mmetsp:Transcript_12615/g.44169  ORF Transcript_12615/g.44169 Transcript_12615/m.44169 type:complete len:167 (-) Transcript_12615:1845-2345(-)
MAAAMTDVRFLGARRKVRDLPDDVDASGVQTAADARALVASKGWAGFFVHHRRAIRNEREWNNVFRSLPIELSRARVRCFPGTVPASVVPGGEGEGEAEAEAGGALLATGGAGAGAGSGSGASDSEQVRCSSTCPAMPKTSAPRCWASTAAAFATTRPRLGPPSRV